MKTCLLVCVMSILYLTTVIPHLNELGAHSQDSVAAPIPLKGKGDVTRKLLSRKDLFGITSSSTPVDDSEGFAIPANAAEPTQFFEGSLTLNRPENSGTFTGISDVFQLTSAGDSPWKHLPAFSFEFVQNGSYLIPARQGLAITGNPVWNYIVGPGRVWREDSDGGYMRASLPFSLVQRNQNCVHNGEMTFLFSATKAPRVSNVYYQITQESCYPMKFNLWGIVSARYEPHAVAESSKIKEIHAAELSHRMPSKPFGALAADFPGSNIQLDAFKQAYKDPANITTFGIAIKGVNYVAGCPTRFGEYAFCSDMRLPSYSIAKSAFAGVALMRLGQLYGKEVYGQLIKNFIPQYVVGGQWDATTFGNASDMATGNYNLDGYEADEDSPTMDRFLIDEKLGSKIADAFAFRKNYAPPGTKWIYQSSATFLLTQAMNAYLNEKRGGKSESFLT